MYFKLIQTLSNKNNSYNHMSTRMYDNQISNLVVLCVQM